MLFRSREAAEEEEEEGEGRDGRGKEKGDQNQGGGSEKSLNLDVYADWMRAMRTIKELRMIPSC